MIVEGMTHEQIMEQIDRAHERANTWLERNINQMMRRFRESRKDIIVQRLPVGAKVPNMVLVMEKLDSTGLYARWFIWKESNIGKTFYTTGQCDPVMQYHLFSPHWVSRYIERKGLEYNEIEAMIHYMKQTLGSQVVERETHNAPTQKLENAVEGSLIYQRTSEGINIIDRIGQLHVFKTFITSEMHLKQDREVVEGLNLGFENFDLLMNASFAQEAIRKENDLVPRNFMDQFHNGHQNKNAFSTIRKEDQDDYL